jgi:pSer/pThr/pTyr-binding forkhead associated (FHA) protein
MTADNYILMIQEEGGPQAHQLSQLYYTIGRASTSDIRLHSTRISRLHGALLKIHNAMGQTTYRLVDGNYRTGQPSQNGITVNGQRIAFQDLKHGDQIVFGRAVVAQFLVTNSDSTTEAGAFDQSHMQSQNPPTDQNPTVFYDSEEPLTSRS